MALVAMESPIAFLIGQEFDLSHLADRDIGRHLRPAGTDWRRAAIGATDDKLVPVQMHRVISHGQVAHADANFVILADI